MSEPTTKELLTQILKRMDALEQRLDKIQRTTDDVAALNAKAPVVIEAVASGAEFVFARAEESGIDPIANSLAATDVVIEASKMESINTVKRLLAKQAMLHRSLDAVDKLETDGTLDVLMDHGVEMAPRVAKLMKNPVFSKLLDATLDDTNALDTVSAATTALIETRTKGFSPLGLFGQLKMLGDADVQKAMGFTLSIAKRFGQLL